MFGAKFTEQFRIAFALESFVSCVRICDWKIFFSTIANLFTASPTVMTDISALASIISFFKFDNIRFQISHNLTSQSKWYSKNTLKSILTC